MFNKMKYIVIYDCVNEHAIMFSPFLKHSLFKECLLNSYPGMLVISAGFCSVGLSGEYMNCFGNSDSLNLKSRKEDSALFNFLFR